MIAIILHDLRWRLLALLGLLALLYAFEPGFHQHGTLAEPTVALGPLGISATLSYLAGLTMIVLLGGFISTDRREGYGRIIFSHPVSPLAYYGLRWGIALLIALGAATIFLVFGQILAWGEFQGGWSGLILPLVSALVYGGLLAFLSVLLPRGDAWITFLLIIVPAFVPELITVALSSLPPALRQGVLLILPPQGAFQRIYEGLLLDAFSWSGVGFAAAYGLICLAAAAALLRVREWE